MRGVGTPAGRGRGIAGTAGRQHGAAGRRRQQLHGQLVLDRGHTFAGSTVVLADHYTDIAGAEGRVELAHDIPVITAVIGTRVLIDRRRVIADIIDGRVTQAGLD